MPLPLLFFFFNSQHCGKRLLWNGPVSRIPLSNRTCSAETSARSQQCQHCAEKQRNHAGRFQRQAGRYGCPLPAGALYGNRERTSILSVQLIRLSKEHPYLPPSFYYKYPEYPFTEKFCPFPPLPRNAIGTLKNTAGSLHSVFACTLTRQ